MADPRDIFIVCNNLAEPGGVQNWARTMARLFTQRGETVHLISVTGPAPDATRLVPGRVRYTPRPRGLVGTFNAVAWSRWLRNKAQRRRAGERLTTMFRTARPGSVVIVTQVWAMEWVACADTRGLTVIGMSHESYRASKRSSRYARVQRYYRDVDRMLVLTDEDADDWARDGMSNVDAMPNPLTVTPATLPTLSEPVVVALARLSHEKGIDLLVEAWSLVCAQYPEWRLRVYGTGAEEADLRELAAKSGAERLDFCGHTDDIDAALAGASIYVLPSRDEGFPIALMEGMAYGLAPVAFDCAPGVRALISDEVNGLLVEPGNVIAFAAALERLMKDEDLRRTIGAQARKSVARYSPEEVMGRWYDLFALLRR